MTWTEAIGLVTHPARDRFIDQARDDNPNLGQRDAARATLVRLAGGGEPPLREYPSLMTQAGNAIGALGRAIASGLATVDDAEQKRRLGICRSCEFFDAAHGRCTKCSCFARWKARLASEHCPLESPKW